MKRYLIFGFSSQLGGIETFLFNYIGEMQKQDPENSFDFILLDEMPDFFKTSILSQNKTYIIPRRTKNPILYYKSLKNILKKGRYDVLWYNVCTLSDITLLKLAKKYNVSCRIVHSHNSENMGGRMVGWLHNMNRNVVKKYATDFFACSDLAGRFMFPKLIWENKGKVVKNGIYVEKYEFSEKIRQRKRNSLGIQNEIVVGNIGRFHFQKNHSFIIEIFDQILKEDPTAKLLLIGNGSLKENIVRKARSLGVLENIIFLENRLDVNELLQAMDVFLFPSLFEGLGIALIEAQAADLPCVISDTIPQDARLTKRITSLSLGESAEVWAGAVLGVLDDEKRTTQTRLIREEGFDIVSNAKEILRYIEER